MNQISLNDRIKNFANGAASVNSLKAMLNYPLFIHSYKSDDLTQRMKSMNDGVFNVADHIKQDMPPYNGFRFLLKAKEEDKSVSFMCGIFMKDDEKIIMIFFPPFGDVGAQLNIKDIGTPDLEIGHTLHVNGVGIDPTDKSKSILYSGLGAIGVLLKDVNSPHNFIAEVKPDSVGKSVEWIQARQHLILIDKRHPINNKNLQSQKVFKMNTNDTILRMAHSRRAHYRMLRSHIFKKKAGQRIFIKSMWVGPKEWKDSIGNIYKIKI